MSRPYELGDAKGQCSLQSDDAAWGSEEIVFFLFFRAVWRMVGRDAVDRAIFQPFDDREPVCLGARGGFIFA